ncbi:OmpA family protein [Pedobacter agri]|uniref:OmpA family protein n=1 Tax=Pedobacter agri TaxID=454586 RepID=UPI003977B0DF
MNLAGAAVELNELVKIMTDNPTIWIELGSHTDSRGKDSYNLTLSQKRAESAVQYIISKGIDKNRITAKGYGETQLVNKCANGINCSDEEH